MSDQPTGGAYPYLTIEGAAAAIEFYKTVFGATEVARHMADDKQRILHCTLALNGGTVFLSDAFPEFGNAAGPRKDQLPPVAISLLIASPAEVDRLAALAKEHGATIEWGPMDAFWGARFASLRDPFGHRWMLNADQPRPV